MVASAAILTVYINREPPGARRRTDVVIRIPALPDTFNQPARTLPNFALDAEWRAIADFKLWFRAGLPSLTSRWSAETRAVFKTVNARLDEVLGEMEYREDLPVWKHRHVALNGRSGDPVQPTWLPVPREAKFSLRDLTRSD